MLRRPGASDLDLLSPRSSLLVNYNRFPFGIRALVEAQLISGVRLERQSTQVHKGLTPNSEAFESVARLRLSGALAQLVRIRFPHFAGFADLLIAYVPAPSPKHLKRLWPNRKVLRIDPRVKDSKVPIRRIP